MVGAGQIVQRTASIWYEVRLREAGHLAQEPSAYAFLDQKHMNFIMLKKLRSCKARHAFPSKKGDSALANAGRIGICARFFLSEDITNILELYGYYTLHFELWTEFRSTPLLMMSHPELLDILVEYHLFSLFLFIFIVVLLFI